MSFRTLLESLPKVAVQGYDRDRRVIYWNAASTQLYGYHPEEAQGRLLEELIIPGAMRADVIRAHQAWIEKGVEIPSSELELQGKSGAPVAVYSQHVMLGEHTANPLMFCIDVDLSQQNQARRDLDFAIRYDALTQLPNRQTFERELNECLEKAKRLDDCLAVIYIDLDRFAEINDAKGYETSDILLASVAKRLRGSLQSADILSRFGSDEFVLALPNVKDNDGVMQRVEEVLDLFNQPFTLADESLHITASLGVALFPDNGSTARELIHNADTAKNRAKQFMPKRCSFFDQQIHDELLYQRRLVEQLRSAIGNGELALHYQPQVALASGRIENIEALLRWFPPHGKPISPGEFIPLAERSDLIHDLGDWVIKEACRQKAEWREQGLGDQRIDINLSGKQLSVPETFDCLNACMSEHGLGPRDIGVELTESVLIESDEQILELLRQLYHRGMKIAIDDFGTGYSSLSYLKRFPVTSLKIDRTFVMDAPDNPVDRAIMAAMVFIGHNLGLEVVAEGVENEEQLEVLHEIGCDLVQGYHFFRPMSASDMTGILAGLKAQ